MEINGTYCFGEHSDTLEIWPNPSLDTSVVTDIPCWGDSTGIITITASNGTPYTTTPLYLYNWSGPNGFTSDTTYIDSLIAGVYNLQVVDMNGCAVNESFIVNQTE